MSNQNTQHRSVEVLSTVYKRHKSFITNIQGEDGSGSYNKYGHSSWHTDNKPKFLLKFIGNHNGNFQKSDVGLHFGWVDLSNIQLFQGMPAICIRL